MPRSDQGNFCIWFLQIATINFTIFDGLLFFFSHLPSQKHFCGLQQRCLSGSKLLSICVSYHKGMLAGNMKRVFIALKSPTLALAIQSLDFITWNRGNIQSDLWIFFYERVLQILYPFLIADHVLILSCHIMGQTCLPLLNAAFPCQTCPERDYGKRL